MSDLRRQLHPYWGRSITRDEIHKDVVAAFERFRFAIIEIKRLPSELERLCDDLIKEPQWDIKSRWQEGADPNSDHPKWRTIRTQKALEKVLLLFTETVIKAATTLPNYGERNEEWDDQDFEDPVQERLRLWQQRVVGQCLSFRPESAQQVEAESPHEAQAETDADAPDDTPNPPPRLKRGRRPIDPAHHQKLVEIVDACGGPNALAGEDVLERVCKQLDGAGVPIPQEWHHGDLPAKSWKRQCFYEPDKSRKVVAERYRKVKFPAHN